MAQIISPEDLEIFRVRLLDDLSTLITRSQKKDTEQFLKSAEVKSLLKISSGTLQNLRITGVLTPRKIGGTLFYSMDEIQSLLKGK